MLNRLEKLEDSPYVGPRSFERKDRDLFFGRDNEAMQIISLILSNPLTLIYSQSGVGKTSIINTKIIYELENHYKFQTFPSARVRGLLAADKIPKEISNIYIFNTLQSLKPDVDPEAHKKQTLSGFLKQHVPKLDKEHKSIPRIIVFDQLEELFSLYPENWYEQQQDFFEQIAEALNDDSMLRIVLVIREEYLAQLSPFSNIVPGKLRARFRLERLTKESALSAVTEPLKQTNHLFFGPEVAEKLVDDLLTMTVENIFGKIVEMKGEYVEPVYLQVVCQRLWMQVMSSGVNEITQEHLKGFGNVNQALTEFYLDTISYVSKQTGIKMGKIRNWFDKTLITSSGTRGIVHRDSNSTGGLPNNAVDLLQQRYLIRQEWRSGSRWYELTHDRLIGPIRESNKEWYYQKSKFRRSLLRKRVTIPIIVTIVIGISLFAINAHNTIVQQDEVQMTLTDSLSQANLINKAYILSNSGNKIGGIKYLDKVLAVNSTNIDALFGKAFILDDSGNFTGAMKYYDKVLAIDPTDIAALYNKGLILDNWRRYEEAITYYDKVLAIDPTDTDALNNKGLILDNWRRYEEAITYYDKVLAINSTDIAALYNKGLALDNLGRYEEAITYYDKVLAIDPTDTDSLFNKGLILGNSGNHAGAIEYYDKVLAINSTDTDALNNKGLALDNLGRYEEAITYYDKVLAINSTDTDALYNKGLALDNSGNHAGAVEYYDKILAINSTDTDTLNVKAFALAKLGKNEEALPLIEKALNSVPDDEYYLSTAAFIMYNLGKYDQAKNYYDKALKIDPNLKNILEEIELKAFNSIMKQ